jgi:hypothetical protein
VAKSTSIRDTINAELKRRGWTKYKLWMAVKDDGISKPTLYDFLNGDRNITSEKLEQVLKALNLTISSR